MMILECVLLGVIALATTTVAVCAVWLMVRLDGVDLFRMTFDIKSLWMERKAYNDDVIVGY